MSNNSHGHVPIERHSTPPTTSGPVPGPSNVRRLGPDLFDASGLGVTVLFVEQPEPYADPTPLAHAICEQVLVPAAASATINSVWAKSPVSATSASSARRPTSVPMRRHDHAAASDTR